MQLVMMVFRTSFEHEVLPLVEHEQLPYTRFDSVQGKGDTGSVPGSVTWVDPIRCYWSPFLTTG